MWSGVIGDVVNCPLSHLGRYRVLEWEHGEWRHQDWGVTGYLVGGTLQWGIGIGVQGMEAPGLRLGQRVLDQCTRIGSMWRGNTGIEIITEWKHRDRT